MCDKAILENYGTLKSVPDCYKNQQICDKAVDNYLHALEFVPDCYMTLKMCEKAVNTLSPTMIKLLINVFLHLFIFLIDIKLKKCVT